MSVYTINGDVVNTLYDKNGSTINQAYDINGHVVYQPTASSIRVATYNVGGWYIGSGTNVPTEKKTAYIALQQSILSAVEADIVCFQEYWNAFCADGTTADSVIGQYFTQQEKTNADTTWNGHVTASNGIVLNDYESIRFVNYYSTAPGYEKCYIDVGGKTVCIINTHLSTAAGGKKEPQSQEIFDAVQNEPYFIIMGDFNTEVSDYDAIVKKFVDAGYHSVNLNGTDHHFSTFYASAGIGKPTDQIITSANITISDAYVNTLKLTDGLGDKIDHIPLVADLVIN